MEGEAGPAREAYPSGAARLTRDSIYIHYEFCMHQGEGHVNKTDVVVHANAPAKVFTDSDAKTVGLRVAGCCLSLSLCQSLCPSGACVRAWAWAWT